MAEILDPQGAEDRTTPVDGEQPTTLDDIVAAAEDSTNVSGQPDNEPKPDSGGKYNGKNIDEIIQMHQEAEKLLGRQSAEVGELRRVVDGFIQGQTQQPAQPTATQDTEEEVDFFDNPERAIAKAIENHPEIQQSRQSRAEMQRTAAIATLQTKHPDLPEILGDPSFMEWVQQSPTRTRLYAEADKSFNADSADELVSTWKERKELANKTVKVEETARRQEVQRASTGATTGSGESSKKVYRRADIIKLMQTDPQRYQQLQPEIMQAYAEKRVR